MATKQIISFDKLTFRATLALLLRFIFSVPILILIILSIAAYILLGRQATQNLVQKTHDRQLHLANAGASSITNLVSLASASLVDTARLISSSEEDPTIIMQNHARSWANTPIIATLLSDAEGTVRYRSRETLDQGNLPFVTDRPYFTWAKTASLGEVYISDPVIPIIGEKNEYIIPIATPVIRDGRFFGVLVLRLSLNKLAEQQLNLLKFTDSTRVYLIKNDGTLLHSPFPEIQGKNYLHYLEENPFPGSTYIKDQLASAAQSTSPGQAVLILPNMETKTLTPFLISHVPLILDSQHWTIALATPQNDAVSFVASLYINQLGLLLTLFLILLVLVIRATKEQTYREINQN